MEDQIKQKVKAMQDYRISHVKQKKPTVSKPPFRSPFSERRMIEVTPDMLESYQYRRSWIPLANHNSTQRNNMVVAQEKNLVVPLRTEVPILSSSFEQDMFAKCSVIRRIRGTVTLLHTLQYQDQRIFIYLHNGVVKLLDTNGIHDNAGYIVFTYSDLEHLTPGETYDINSDDENFCLEYPHCYDPVSSVMTRGNNLLTMNSIMVETQGDSCMISESAVKKFTYAKVSNITIELRNKKIISKYPNLFPDINTMIEDPVVCKIVDDEGSITALTQSHLTPLTEEEDQLIVVPNSYISNIRVLCNKPIENEELEKRRQEYLDFRKKVHSTLSKVISQHKQCDPEIYRYLENYKYQNLRTAERVIDTPMISLRIVTIVVPKEGFKITNRSGAKATIEEIYPDGKYKDDYGRNVELVFSALTFVNRIITGFIYEQFVTAVMYAFTQSAKQWKPSVQKKHLVQLCKLFHVDYEIESRFTEEEINTLVQTNDVLPMSLLPWSAGLDMKMASKIRQYAMKHFNLRESDITITDEYGKQTMTAKHMVGYTYQHIDHHDPIFFNSSTGQPEINTKGLPKESTDDRHRGRTLRSKKPARIDVQCCYNLVGLIPNYALKEFMVTVDSRVSIAEEEFKAIGASIGFTKE